MFLTQTRFSRVSGCEAPRIGRRGRRGARVEIVKARGGVMRPRGLALDDVRPLPRVHLQTSEDWKMNCGVCDRPIENPKPRQWRCGFCADRNLRRRTGRLPHEIPCEDCGEPCRSAPKSGAVRRGGMPPKRCVPCTNKMESRKASERLARRRARRLAATS